MKEGVNLNELETLRQDIIKLRDHLNKLISDNNQDLHDKEVIEASKVLDTAINEYIVILNNRIT